MEEATVSVGAAEEKGKEEEKAEEEKVINGGAEGDLGFGTKKETGEAQSETTIGSLIEKISKNKDLTEEQKTAFIIAIRKSIYRTVKETGEQCRIVRPLDEMIAELEWGPKKWEEIRIWTDDVKKIAENTNLPVIKIEIVKRHLFENEHILDDGIRTFDPDSEIAAAWDRLYQGDYIQNDIRLIEHEYHEAMLEKGNATKLS